MNGAQLTVAALRREGIDHVFGLPGTTVMHLIDALGEVDDIRFVPVRHEQVAAMMADGFARGSGRLGACLASRGPGAANLAIGVHNACAESIPMLVLVGQVPDAIVHRDSFEEMDLLRFFEPMTKWAVEIHETNRIPELLQRAVRTALSGRPGPVLVSLPLDVQLRREESVLQPRFRLSPTAPNPADVDASLTLLAESERPVIIVGGGMQGSTFDEDLIILAERLHVPVVTTWGRKGVFPNDSELFCGSLGYGALATTVSAVQDADVILALGCKFSEFTTKRWSLLPDRAELIHVDVSEEVLGRVYVPTVAICADARVTTAAMRAAAKSHIEHAAAVDARRQRVRALRAAYVEETQIPELATPPSGVSSAAVTEALRTILDSNRAVVINDASSMGAWLQRHLTIAQPAGYYIAAGGSLGWGLPAAMGIQLSRPEDRIIGLIGDGSFWMVAQDLETAVRENIPVVVVIANNFSFGNTRDRQRVEHGGRYSGVFYGNPDFAEFARLLGAHGERVEAASELVPAIQRALDSGRPAVVDVIQDRSEGLPPDLVPPPAAE
ncbi:thiamine pyrophosphate-binding protein [Mycobacterium intracellulare]|uniref:thiamine pyrophosphate-binding protein n=1 Tax=Mycobacterium intracellulare TaxID=1767 RepID=UPI003363D1BC